MSTTATQELLHDYDIHLTTSVPSSSSSSSPPQSSPPISLPNSIATIFPNSPPANDAPRPFAENPSDWTNDWRQTPPYRPINRGLNRELRPWGTSVAEQGFILHMFEGVLLQAVGQVLS